MTASSDGVMESWSHATLQHSAVPALRSLASLLLFLFVLLHRALLDFLAILQFTADGFVTAGNHFLPLSQALGDFHVSIVATTPFHRRHFDFVAFNHENDLHRFGSLALFVGPGTVRLA